MAQPTDVTNTTPHGVQKLFLKGTVVEGILIPEQFESNRPMTEHVQLLKALEMREDDVVILNFSKSGTHWIWEIVSMLLSGKAEYEKRSKDHLMMEITPIESLQSEPSPRVFNSHLQFRLLPRQIREKKVKVIHMYRNIKDVFVSAFFHCIQETEMADFTFDGFEKRFFDDEKLPLGTYISFMKQMDDFVKSNPDLPMFATSFEDMKEDPEKTVKEVAEFLGVKTSPQLIKDITEATSFTKMKKAEETKAHSPLIPSVQFYRKGEVGDWKNYMTVAQSERFDAAITQLTSCDFRFRYTL